MERQGIGYSNQITEKNYLVAVLQLVDKVSCLQAFFIVEYFTKKSEYIYDEYYDQYICPQAMSSVIKYERP
ncbi:hypothetical protein GCM10007199_29790 [Fictibacillus barbaricus]|nr:hypothetical protein GCM10007199_29790 [Fictibacillus barbaricus]